MNSPVFSPREIDLDRLNKITKYPSIPMYHAFDIEKGILLDEPVLFEGTVVVTEQINGVHARVLLCPDGTYLIGSRDEFLFGKGDLVGNPAHGIVDALWEWTESLDFLHLLSNPLMIYLEVFEYDDPGVQDVDFRIIDIAEFSTDRIYEMLDWPTTLLSSHYITISGKRIFWHKWDHEEQLVGRVVGGKLAPLAPRILRIDGSKLPRTVDDMTLWLADQLPKSNVGSGAAQGVVLRTLDRKTIAKATIDDYRRTIKHRLAHK